MSPRCLLLAKRTQAQQTVISDCRNGFDVLIQLVYSLLEASYLVFHRPLQIHPCLLNTASMATAIPMHTTQNAAYPN